MKKTLIALAAVAAMGAASAEVTLYGKLDAGVSVINTTGAVNQSAQITSGNYEASRIGVKGSSDIAGGVKGVFQLEGGLGATDGSFSNFGRVATLGVTGNFGSVTAGLQWTPYDSAFNDGLENNGFAPTFAAFCTSIHCDAGNATVFNPTSGNGNTKNSIQYTTPTFNGFNAAALYANGGDATASTSSSNYTGFGLNYAVGPLGVQFATESLKPTTGSTVNAWIMTGSYNLGMATAFLGAEGTDAAAAGKSTGYSASVAAPVAKALTVGLGFATDTQTLSGAADSKINSAGVQAVYAWNAATSIYAGYRKTDTTARDTTVSTATKFATGVRYNF
jgi:predicted porin